MQILQFTNATMQALHEKAATVANTAQPYGPFVGEWWERYLAEVLVVAQAELGAAIVKRNAELARVSDELIKTQVLLDAAYAELRARPARCDTPNPFAPQVEP